MNVERLIQELKKPLDEQHILAVANLLAQRLGDMLRAPEHVATVASHIGYTKMPERDGIVEWWGWLIKEVYVADKLDAFQETVVPLLPPGQPYSADWILRYEVIAGSSTDKATRKEARDKLKMFAAWNAKAKQAATTA